MLAPLLALLALAGPASAWDSDRPLERRSTTSEPHGSIKWFDCPDAPKHDFDCGYLSVPMSYNPKDKLFKKTVSLALRRQRAKGKKWASAPHLFINPGGPGASGTGLIAGEPFFYDKLGGKVNLISWDPRGVNMTLPFSSCYATDEFQYAASSWDDSLGSAVDYRGGQISLDGISFKQYQLQTDTFYRKFKAVQTGKRLACENNGDKDMLRSASTALTARDMRSIMLALGLKEVNYWGFSYGTHLGQTFARMFPESVGRFAIDGIVDSNSYSNNLPRFLVDSQEQVNPSFDGFLSTCATSKRKCALNDPKLTPRATRNPTAASLKKRFFQLSADLATNPRPKAVGIMTSSNLWTTWTSVMATPNQWPQWAQYLASLEKSADLSTEPYEPHDFIDLTKNVFRRTVLNDDFEEMSEATVLCTDAKPFSLSFEGVQRIGYQSAKLSVAGESTDIEHVGGILCSDWGFTATEVYRSFDKKIKTKNPLLITSSLHDPATPLSSAYKTQKLFEGSHIVTREGYGHCAAIGTSACLDNILNLFFLQGKLPKDGTACSSEDANPFLSASDNP